MRISDWSADVCSSDLFLGGVVQVYGPDLMRYKGILYMKGINRRMLFQGVHMMMGAEPGKPWTAAEKPSTKMVFIGRKLPQEIFTRGLEQCLAGRSEERRVGTECVSTCRSRWLP